MKQRYTLFLIIIIAACRRDKPIDKPRPHIDTPEILVAQTIEGCQLRNNSDLEFPLDSTTQASTFSLFKLSNETIYRPIDLSFSLKQKGTLNSVRWKIGNEPNERTNQSPTLTFSAPVGTINLQAIVSWVPSATFVSRTDTVRGQIDIIATPALVGSFQGANTDNLSDTFTVRISDVPDIVTGGGSQIWGIKNLFKNFPVTLSAQPFTKGFGLCAAPFPYPQRYNVGGKFYSQPFALGILSPNNDSITIKYSYAVYENTTSVNNIQTVIKTFTGKKQ